MMNESAPYGRRPDCGGDSLKFDASMLPVGPGGSVRVSFADRIVLFTRDHVPEGFHAERVGEGAAISRAKVITFLGKYNCVAFLSADPLRLFRAFAAQFVQVEAAGGVVENACGDVALIRRNGRWDLPKGHREAGESMTACAAREASEETGAHVTGVAELLCSTLHCYNVYGQWEMKLTAWYRMLSDGPDALIPQGEEGIVAAEWVPRGCAGARIKESYPTIKSVFAALCARTI